LVDDPLDMIDNKMCWIAAVDAPGAAIKFTRASAEAAYAQGTWKVVGYASWANGKECKQEIIVEITEGKPTARFPNAQGK
jgi:hypothetical protein